MQSVIVCLDLSDCSQQAEQDFFSGVKYLYRTVTESSGIVKEDSSSDSSSFEFFQPTRSLPESPKTAGHKPNKQSKPLTTTKSEK
jgi:hypothetical protein